MIQDSSLQKNDVSPFQLNRRNAIIREVGYVRLFR